MRPALFRFMSFSLLLLAAGFFSCTEKKPAPPPAALIGIEPVLSKIDANNYTEVLRSWNAKGYRNRTVIHISPFDGVAVIPSERLRRITESMKGRDDTHGPGDEGVTGGDYLFAAARMGMLKKIYWVMPFDHIDYINAEARIQEFLKSSVSHFSPREIESMKFKNGCVSGRLSGIETHICSMSSLPAFQEPVLVAVNGGFFSVFAATKKKNILGTMKSFFDSLSFLQLRTDSLHVIPAQEGMARQGYIHEELTEMFKQPDIFRQPIPPELWNLRDQADNLLSGGGVREALHLLKEHAHEYPNDPYLILMRGTAELLAGVNAEGLKRMEKECGENQLFCRGLVDAGLLLKNGGEGAKAAHVFERVIMLNPGYAPARSEREKMREKSVP